MLRTFDRSAYLERVEEVVEAPGNNYVVVKRDKERYYTGRDSYSAQPGMYSVPDAQGTLSHALSEAQFN